MNKQKSRKKKEREWREEEREKGKRREGRKGKTNKEASQQVGTIMETEERKSKNELKGRAYNMDLPSVSNLDFLALSLSMTSFGFM